MGTHAERCTRALEEERSMQGPAETSVLFQGHAAHSPGTSLHPPCLVLPFFPLLQV